MDNNSSVVILVGGEGSRLKGINPHLPKSLFRINDQTLLDRILNSFDIQKMNQVFLITNKNHDIFKEYVEQNYNLNIKVIKDNKFKGTGGAILEKLQSLNEHIIVILGDIFYNLDLNQLLDFHLAEDAAATIVCHPSSHPLDSDLVKLDENNQILKIYSKEKEKPKIFSNMAMTGIYIFKKQSLAQINLKSIGVKDVIDLSNDIVPKLIEFGHKLKAFISHDYIKDAGTPKRIYEINQDLLSNISVTQRENRPIVFFDRDGTIIEEKGFITDINQVVIKKSVAKCIKDLNDLGILVCMVTNQPVIARGDCTFEEVNVINDYISMLLALENGAYFNLIKICPHHPDSGFKGEVSELKITCSCRKPGIKMFEECIQELQANRSKMFVIGDTDKDIIAGQQIGARTLLISKDVMGMNLLTNPDYIESDFNKVLLHILKDFYNENS
jgi:histidinol-phosphate phosphatase family protein